MKNPWLKLLLKIYLLFVVICLFNGCDSNSEQKIESILEESEEQMEEVERIFPSDISVEKFFWGEEPTQFGELYRPVEYEGSLPVVITLHGGCWLSRYDLSYMQDLAIYFAQQGMAVWNIEYRSIGNGGEWPNMFLDVGQAADYVRYLARERSLDEQRVVSLGHSAGGHLSLWLLSRKRIPEDSPISRSWPIELAGAISLGGIPDLRSNACSQTSQQIMGAGSISPAEQAERLRETSPISMLPTGMSSVLIVGSEDRIVEPVLSERYVSAAVQAGDSSQYFVMDGLGHFSLIDTERMDMVFLQSQIEMLWSIDTESSGLKF